MTKLVIDSNALRDDALARFLEGGDSRIAVLIDYAAMEALKGDPIVGMYESMKILRRFPAKVQVLKTTGVVCGLSGHSKGLQRRLVDVPLTNEFSLFCRNLDSARAGATSLSRQLSALGLEASAHLARMEQDASGFPALVDELARQFPAHERQQLMTGSPRDLRLLNKFGYQAAELSVFLFDEHPSVKERPRVADLLDTFIFRSSVSALLLAVRYASYGGIRDMAPAKIRNDMVDSHFATYATFFDGLLSRDARATWLHDRSRKLLKLLDQIQSAHGAR